MDFLSEMKIERRIFEARLRPERKVKMVDLLLYELINKNLDHVRGNLGS